MSQHLEIWQVTEPRRPSAARAATMQQSEFGFFWSDDADKPNHGPFGSFDEALGDFVDARKMQRHATAFGTWWGKMVERQ